jgi:hypothetical protein
MRKRSPRYLTTHQSRMMASWNNCPFFACCLCWKTITSSVGSWFFWNWLARLGKVAQLESVAVLLLLIPCPVLCHCFHSTAVIVHSREVLTHGNALLAAFLLPAVIPRDPKSKKTMHGRCAGTLAIQQLSHP